MELKKIVRTDAALADAENEDENCGEEDDLREENRKQVRDSEGLPPSLGPEEVTQRRRY